MSTPGNQLLALCKTATQDILLVAPFIKVTAFQRLLTEISESIQLRCVTRWHPHEIAAGVSDIEIWGFFKEQPNRELWLRSDLHAKYYRADDFCLVGSANITLTALGWTYPFNLELLLPYEAQHTDLLSFESQLFSGAVRVNEGIYDQVLAAVQKLPQHTIQTDLVGGKQILEEVKAEENSLPISSEVWLPTLRHPEDLYKAYKGKWDRLGSGSQVAAAADLQVLAIPPLLTKEAFYAYVGAMLLQMPLVQAVDKFVLVPQRFGAVKSLLDSLPCKDVPGFDAKNAWQTLMRWLLYFLPNRYSVSTPRHSEVFTRIK